MSATEFTPDRSAALRELLLTTVREEPKRQRRLQILLTTVLAAVAIVLAGGTAALALTGVIRFGDDAPAPAPAPTSTFTPTPTPTSTPSPAPTKPVVQSGPVAPHDVDSLPGSTRWSIDLPGDKECTAVQTFTLSDGRALYLSGQRPKEYESTGSPCGYQRSEDVALTLVDTQNGTVLWSREWKFATEYPQMTDVIVLGTSGRAVISYSAAVTGPQEVVDLATGARLAPYAAVFESPLHRAVPVPDNSGDLVMAFPKAASTTISRFDPRDPAHPVWSTDENIVAVSLGALSDGSAAVPATFAVPSSKFTNAGWFSLDTGKLDRIDDSPGAKFFESSLITLLWVPVGHQSASIVAYDAKRNILWTRDLADRAMVEEIHTVDQRSGSHGGYDDAGLLAITDESTLTVVDELTGATQWTASTAGCKTGPLLGNPDTLIDDSRDAYVTIFLMSSVCTMSRADGEQIRETIPLDGWKIPGSANTYGYGEVDATEGTAYSRETGDVLWTRPLGQHEFWSFDGGYLVSHQDTHIESIG